jgi:hypothetical protein
MDLLSIFIFETIKSDFRIPLNGSLRKNKKEMELIALELVEHYLYFPSRGFTA